MRSGNSQEAALRARSRLIVCATTIKDAASSAPAATAITVDKQQEGGEARVEQDGERRHNWNGGKHTR